ncbi:hypothetical protein BS50DRAFT_308431 [Corynespora cassiicola Philippines]|uniref:Uncharacterized protein n=1 Tax=Corynespora cassiicola Philippines TaxID=1448308 RepID=A0A2T2NXS3_CORCC|nr:hypothetical protein BS50DRAFT_308431 [Corynespora cassiicola Philippines]
MAEFERELRPFDLKTTIKADRGAAAIIIDVGSDGKNTTHNSGDLIDNLVNSHLANGQRMSSATKLYVIGEFKAIFKETHEASDSKHPSGYYMGQIAKDEQHLTGKRHQASDYQGDQWKRGVSKVCELIKAMTNLQEVTWISTLPFQEEVWAFLPTTLTKLIIDIGNPIRLDTSDSSYRKVHISRDGMKPLVRFTQLRELRLFNMMRTFQSIIWETVFRNKAEGQMQVLDLTMAEHPIIRADNWVKADGVCGINVVNPNTREYKGKDGNGMLYHTHGMGEYLDDLCMRKARLASYIGETVPLPLWCLKLDGFVIDRLPFEHELSGIVLLTCGPNCVDAGIRPPKTTRAPKNAWGASVKSSQTHCLIKWPNWARIYTGAGEELDVDGHVVENAVPKDA